MDGARRVLFPFGYSPGNFVDGVADARRMGLQSYVQVGVLLRYGWSG